MELFDDSGHQRMNSRFITANELSTIWCGLIMNFTSYTSIAIANSAMLIQAQTIIRVFIERFECGCSTQTQRCGREREKVKHIRIPSCVSGSAQVNKAWVADTT